MDLDLFDRDDHRHQPRRRHRYDDRGRPRRPDRGDRRDRFRRRAHPHLFSWVLLGGGVVLLGLALIAIASSLGVWGWVADVYFAASTAVLPASWHDEWLALPGIAHVAIVLGALFVAAGVAGEVLD